MQALTRGNGLQDKLVRSGEGEQRWGLFQAYRPMTPLEEAADGDVASHPLDALSAAPVPGAA
jgi:hypothetical protein